MPRIPGPITPDYLTALLTERLEMGPPARKEAVVASFAQVAALCPDRLGRDSLLLAMRTVGVPREGDAPPVAARRATCAAIAAALEWQPGEMNAAYDALPPASAANGYAVDGGGFGPAEVWFQVQIDAWANSDDPRQKAMAATAARELEEIRNA